MATSPEAPASPPVAETGTLGKIGGEAEKAVQDAVSLVEKPSAGTVSNFLSAAAPVIAAAPTAVQETRRGWKTSEFWGGIGAVIVAFLSEVDSKEKVIVGGIASIYALARGIAKNGVGNTPPA